jgi:hypothetical protein
MSIAIEHGAPALAGTVSPADRAESVYYRTPVRTGFGSAPSI